MDADERFASFYLIPRTLQLRADDTDPLIEDLSRNARDYLFELAPARPADTVALLRWRFHAGTRAIDPGLIAEFRARALDRRRVLLAIVSAIHSSVFDGPDHQLFDDAHRLREQSQVDLAWRVERHWLVEWSGLDDEPRPPLLFAADRAVLIFGSTLPPKLRPSLAALSAFPVVTADELRAAVEYLGEQSLSSAELSRVLTYAQSVGLLQPTSPDIAEAYWTARSRRDRRPLRTFVSAAAALVTSESVLSVFVGPSREWRGDWSSLWQLDHDGRATHESREMLGDWKALTATLRERGARTI